MIDSNTKILVTGAAGFIGSWICKQLVKDGYSEIYCIDDLSGTLGSIENIQDLIDEKNIEFIKLDLASEYTKDTIKEIKPEIIYHLAANARESGSFFQPYETVRRNYWAYINTLEPAIKTGQLSKMILFSSMAVYGNQSPPFEETIPRKPVDIYGINKSAMEESTELLADIHNFDYTIIRPHNVYGKYQSLKDKYRNVFGIWMNSIMRKEPVNIYGDGNQIRGFSYIQNSLDCYINAMNDNCNGEVINLGGKEPTTINDASKLVLKYMGVDQNYPINHLPDRYREVKVAYCTCGKSEKLLGYKEDISLEKGISNMSKWALEQGKQEWTTEKLAIWNSRAPENWK